MEEEMSLEDFILLEDTIAISTRYNDYFINQVENTPYIRTSTILSSQQIISYFDSNKFNDLFEDTGPAFISMIPSVLGLLDRPNFEASGIIQVQQQPYLNLTGQGVLLGFVDTGIDYTNDVFKHEDGTTKIKYIWDQTINGSPPNDFYFGTEYTENQINEALISENPLRIVPHEDTVGHGTFLASVARWQRK